MKCPTCGSVNFYAKDPDDEYEEYRFALQGNEVVPEQGDADTLAVIKETEAYCERCAWHGRLEQLKK
jgi:hypothetical protein